MRCSDDAQFGACRVCGLAASPRGRLRTVMIPFGGSAAGMNRIGSPGNPAMFRSETKVNSLASLAGWAPGDCVAAWQRTQY